MAVLARICRIIPINRGDPPEAAGRTHGPALEGGTAVATGRRARKLARRMSHHYLKHFSQVIDYMRMGGRAVEGTGLENRQGLTLLVGSNPTPSANSLFANTR